MAAAWHAGQPTPGRLLSERALGRHRAGGRVPAFRTAPGAGGVTGATSASLAPSRPAEQRSPLGSVGREGVLPPGLSYGSLMAHRRSTAGHGRPAAEAIYG